LELSERVAKGSHIIFTLSQLGLVYRIKFRLKRCYKIIQTVKKTRLIRYFVVKSKIHPWRAIFAL